MSSDFRTFVPAVRVGVLALFASATPIVTATSTSFGPLAHAVAG